LRQFLIGNFYYFDNQFLLILTVVALFPSIDQQFHHDVSNEVHTLGYKDEIPGVGMRMNFGKWISFEEIPQFQFTRIPVRDNLQVSWLDILLLVIFNLLFFAIAFVGILRYDVR